MVRAIGVALLVVSVAVALLACTSAPVEAPRALSPGSLEALMTSAVTISAGSELSMVGRQSAVFQVVEEGTTVLGIRGTVDGSTWVTVALASLGVYSRTQDTTFASSGLYLFEPAGGIAALKPYLTTCTACTVTVKARAY